MTIAATRFQSLDKEYDTALASIAESDPRKIMNASFNTVTDIASGIRDAISKIAGRLSINNVLDTLKKAKSDFEAAIGLTKALQTIKNIGDTIRQVRGFVKSTLDSSKFSSKDLERYIGEIFGGDTKALNLFKNLNPFYRDTVLSNVTLGKPFDKLVLTPDAPAGSAQTFTTGKTKYDYPAIAGVIAQVSGQPYDVRTMDPNMILKKTVMLANLGYDASLPGVMNKLIENPEVNSQVRDRAICIVMSEQANKGNVAAVLDMANPATGVLGNSNSPITASPSIITDVMTNFTIPKGTKDNNLDVLAETFLSSMETLDPNWKTSDDDLISLKHVQTVSDDMSKVLHAKVLENAFDENDLDVIFDTDNDVLISAVVGFDPTVNAELDQISRGRSCSNSFCMC